MENEYKTAWGKIWDSMAFGQRQIDRQYNQQIRRQRMHRQSHTMRERFVVYGQIFRKIFSLKLFEPQITAHPIPARLRPWVPANARLLASADVRRMFDRAEYIADLRACCTNSQWAHLCRQYPALS